MLVPRFKLDWVQDEEKQMQYRLMLKREFPTLNSDDSAARDSGQALLYKIGREESEEQKVDSLPQLRESLAIAMDENNTIPLELQRQLVRLPKEVRKIEDIVAAGP
ncbi:unnamed protein product [Boreogadus saida]